MAALPEGIPEPLDIRISFPQRSVEMHGHVVIARDIVLHLDRYLHRIPEVRVNMLSYPDKMPWTRDDPTEDKIGYLTLAILATIGYTCQGFSAVCTGVTEPRGGTIKVKTVKPAPIAIQEDVCNQLQKSTHVLIPTKADEDVLALIIEAFPSLVWLSEEPLRDQYEKFTTALLNKEK